jgi:dTDP-3-amino-3,6-dideoxy-alpha-D-glucopyranose N,N-dimethyltransferase
MPYGELEALVYDVLYFYVKNYCLEALLSHRYIQSFKRSSGRDMLSVACGTGMHDSYFKQWYEIEGIDLSAAQLKVARSHNPAIRYRKADMRDFDMRQQYDVITCMFGSIAYLLDIEEVQAAINQMTKHLKPGGILLLEPWHQPGDPLMGQNVQSAETKGLNVQRVNRLIVEGNITKWTMIYYLIADGVQMKPFTRYHQLALYSLEEQIEALERAGLETFHRRFPQPMPDLLIGRAPIDCPRDTC